MQRGVYSAVPRRQHKTSMATPSSPKIRGLFQQLYDFGYSLTSYGDIPPRLSAMQRLNCGLPVEVCWAQHPQEVEPSN